MAVPSNSGDSSGSPCRHRGGQIRRAFQALIDGGTPEVSGPLCLVAPGGRSPLLGELAGWAAASGLTVLFREGGRFGEELRTADAADCWERLRRRVTAADLVAIEHVEAIGCRARLSSFRHLIDAAMGEGTRLCVSLASHPGSGQFPPDLAGRLAGGLVIPLNQIPMIQIPPGREHEVSPPAGGHPGPSRESPPSLARIFAATARHYGLEVATLIGQSRSRTVCQARSLAMYLARHLTGRSFSTIGAACGNRDHTTALHGTRITSARILSDPGIAADAEAIRRALERKTPRRYAGSTLSMNRR